VDEAAWSFEQKMKKVFATAILLAVTVPSIIAGIIVSNIPSDHEIRGCIVTKMYHVDLCPKSANYAPLRKISPYVWKTIVMTEDSNFWHHHGFDWDSIKKNYEENSKLGFYKRGGSTITQQLAKNMFLSSEKSLTRKGMEAVVTMRLEKVLTKKEILERYLNVIEFGKDIYGIKAAAQHYFQKSPADLDIVESAFLAMLLPNPKKYAASFYKKELSPFASKRIDQIINNLYQFHIISDDEFNGAMAKLATFFKPERTADPDELSGDENTTLDSLEKSSESDEDDGDSE
jgi:monofunctional biosynthetic peptidoglycan transglycosylase